MKNTQILSTITSSTFSDNILIRRPYKKSIKYSSPQIQLPENHFDAQCLSQKLPPIENSVYNHTYQEQGFKSKLGVFIDLGLSPSIPLSHKNIILYNNAKKKTITISDFMSKSAQKQILSSHFFKNIKDEDELFKNTEKIFKKRNSEFSVSGNYTKNFKGSPISSYQELNVLETPTIKRNKNKELKKIDGIILSCEKLLEKKLRSRKNENYKGKRVSI